MKLETAIKILDLELSHTICHENKDIHAATTLAIEALIRVQAVRPKLPSLAYLPLPGESPRETEKPVKSVLDIATQETIVEP